jgi:opacity protein-like surface antigen
LQQNLFNKSFRPYVSAGLDLSYFKYTNNKGISQIGKGVQNNFGVGFLYSAGIEADLYKGLMLRGEYRYEVFSHLLMLGIAYNFSKN